MKKIVYYTVNFVCEIEVKDDDVLDDVIADIEIPEGGRNNSQYCENTFNVLSIEDAE